MTHCDMARARARPGGAIGSGAGRGAGQRALPLRCAAGPRALAALVLLVALDPADTLVAPFCAGLRAVHVWEDGRYAPAAAAAIIRPRRQAGGALPRLVALRGWKQEGTDARQLEFGGPASVMERQILAGRDPGHDSAAVGWEGHVQVHPELAEGGSAEQNRSSLVTWAGVRQATEWDGFCGRRRRRGRARQQSSRVGVEAERRWPMPYSPATHCVGIAWGAGLERRSPGHTPGAGYTSQAQAPTAAPPDPGRTDHGQERQKEAVPDPYAWRNAEMKGHVRLLSAEQLLDFEGGLTSFPLGGHRQRFDLSSLKHRWRECPPREGDRTGPDVRQEDVTKEQQWSADTRVTPLASVRRRFDEQAPLRPP